MTTLSESTMARSRCTTVVSRLSCGSYSTSEVADVLYEPQESRDTTVVHRLRAMVDSLNVVIDQDQRSRQRPVWTTDVAGKVFGIDSQFIHVAGIKIPTAALALLPISLPQG